jgi:hypothetical protein
LCNSFNPTEIGQKCTECTSREERGEGGAGGKRFNELHCRWRVPGSHEIECSPPTRVHRMWWWWGRWWWGAGGVCTEGGILNIHFNFVCS